MGKAVCVIGCHGRCFGIRDRKLVASSWSANRWCSCDDSFPLGLLHFATPKAGFITRKPKGDDRLRMRCIIGTYIYGVPGLILCGLLRRFGAWVQWGILGPYMVIGIGLFLWTFIPLTKRNEKRRLERAQQVMDKWNNRKSQ